MSKASLFGKFVISLFVLFDSVEEVLEHLHALAMENDFFQPDFTPEELEDIPGLYREIVEDPLAFHQALLQSRSWYQYFPSHSVLLCLDGNW